MTGTLYDKYVNKYADLRLELQTLLDNNQKLSLSPEPLNFYIALSLVLQTIENYAIKNKNSEMSNKIFTLRMKFNETDLIPLKNTREPKDQIEKLHQLMTRLNVDSPVTLFAQTDEIDEKLAKEINHAFKKIIELYNSYHIENKIKTPRKRSA